MNLTGRQLLQQVGLKSARTLWRWQRHGLIPAPEMGLAPGGRGRTSYWEESVVRRCQQIVDLQKRGYSLGAVREALEHTVVEEEVASTLRQTFKTKEGEEIRQEDLFHARVMARVAGLIRDDELQRTLLVRMRQSQVFEKALRIVHKELNPLLVFDGADVKVAPDGALALYLQRPDAFPHLRRPLVILPLYLLLIESYAWSGDAPLAVWDVSCKGRQLQVGLDLEDWRLEDILPAGQTRGVPRGEVGRAARRARSGKSAKRKNGKAR